MLQHTIVSFSFHPKIDILMREQSRKREVNVPLSFSRCTNSYPENKYSFKIRENKHVMAQIASRYNIPVGQEKLPNQLGAVPPH